MINRILNNLPYKILSFVIAAILWVVVTSGQAHIGVYPGKIPITFVNRATSLVPISDTTGVQVKIDAEPTVWSKLSVGSFTATADLKGLSEGTFRIPIEVTVANPNVQIVEKNPSFIFVRMEKIEQKTVPIIVKTTGELKDGFSVISAEAIPATVDISGPASVIASINQAETSVAVKNDQDDQTVRGVVHVYDAHGEDIPNITLGVTETDVRLKIGRAATTKSVPISIDTSGKLADGLAIETMAANPPTVTVTGSLTSIAKITTIQTKPLALDKLTASATVSLNLVYPDQVTSVDSITTVKVAVTLKKAEGVRQLIVAPTFINIPSGLKVDSVNPVSVLIVIAGPADKIAAIDPAAIRLEIDTAGLGSGSHTISLLGKVTNLDPSLQVSSYIPTQIIFNLTAS